MKKPAKAARAAPVKADKTKTIAPAAKKPQPKVRAGASRLAKAPAPAMFWQWPQSLPLPEEQKSLFPLIVHAAHVTQALTVTGKVWLDLAEAPIQLSHLVTLPAMDETGDSSFGLTSSAQWERLESLGPKTWILIDEAFADLPPHGHIKTRHLNGKKRTLWLRPTAVAGAWELRATKETSLVSGAELKICVRDDVWKRVTVKAIESTGTLSSWLQRATDHAEQVTGFVLPATWTLNERERALDAILADPLLAQKTWAFSFAGIPAWTKQIQSFARSLSRLSTSLLCFDYDVDVPRESDTMGAGPSAAMTMSGLKHLEIPVLHRISSRLATQLDANLECWAQWVTTGDGVIFQGGSDHALLRRVAANSLVHPERVLAKNGLGQNEVAPSKAK